MASKHPRVVIYNPRLILKRDLGDRELRKATDARRYIDEYREVLEDIAGYMGLHDSERERFISGRIWHACDHLGTLFYSEGKRNVACDYVSLLPDGCGSRRLALKRLIAKVFPELYCLTQKRDGI